MLMLFNYANSEFRTLVDHDGNVWFHVGDLCNILKISNPARMVNTVIQKWCKEWSTGGDGRPAFYTLEPGFYKLVFRSKTVDAEEFQDKVFNEILPQIRKTGAFVDESRFNESEYNRMMSIIEERDNRILAFKDCTENLISDIESSFRTKQYLLVYGFLQNANERRYKTFTQLRKDLENQGFVYPIDRLKLALKFLQERTGNEVVATDKTFNIREGEELQVFLHCIYDSMRFEGNPEDTDTTENMENFEKLYGIKPGKQRTCNYETHSVLEHVENAKKLIN